jgi:hypothetical protein
MIGEAITKRDLQDAFSRMEQTARTSSLILASMILILDALIIWGYVQISGQIGGLFDLLQH